MRKVPNEAMENLTRIANIIKTLTDTKFTGYVKIDFRRGTVKKMEKFEEIVKK